VDGAKGSALEWALALLRAPGERHALRQKPLPAGMEHLLGIAAGVVPDALAEAAVAFGEPEVRIREAAHFYVREVLFFPQADAYRVLGVASDANTAQIKDHHRLLQHWLHPDRLQSEDDAVFAARVNSAWNRLRTAERRQAYDQALQRDRPPEVFDSNDALQGVRAWVAEPEIPRNRWRHRLPMLVLSGACLVLVLLVLRDLERRPQAWDFSAGREEAGSENDDGIGIRMPQSGESGVAPAKPAKPRDRKRQRSMNPAPSPRLAIAVDLDQLAVASPAATPSAPSPVSRITAAAMDAPERIVEPLPVTVPTVPTPAAEKSRPRASSKPAAATETAAPSFARLQSARLAGDQFLRYMGAVDRPPPPIWNSPAIQSSADRLRQELHATAHARLSGVQWRIGNETAVLTSAYAIQSDEAAAGTLTADLIWREGHWLVTGLSMERTR
jgi:hypothetical protein